jgi:hypothetical protein
MPTPQEFCKLGEFKVSKSGDLLCRLNGVIYKVVPFGDDAVQIVDNDKNPIATLTLRDNQFVPARE